MDNYVWITRGYWTGLRIDITLYLLEQRAPILLGGKAMSDINALLAKYESQLEMYEGGADTHASYLSGKIDMLKELGGK